MVRNVFVLPLAVLAYAVALHWVYTDLIQPAFEYSGYRYSDPGIQYHLLTWLATSVTATVLPTTLRKPSAIVLWIMFVVTIAPTSLMGVYLDITAPGDALTMGLGFCAGFVVLCVAVTRRGAQGSYVRRPPPTLFWTGIAIYSALVYGYMALVVGLEFRYVPLLNVYEVRDNFAAATSGAGILSYLLVGQANVINPLVIARGIYSRKWAMLLLGTAGQLLLYSSTGFKTFLFSVPAIIIIALLFRMNSRPPGGVLLLGATGLILVAATVDRLMGTILWSSLFARRFLITPAFLSTTYYDFYSSHPFEMLSHSILEPWVDAPYAYGPARTISTYLTGEPTASMNANFFADGFAHFGWFGVAGVVVVLAIYLRVLDRAAYGLPVAVSSLVAVMPAVVLSNTSAITAMFSHGLVLMVVVVALAPRMGWGRKRRSSPDAAERESAAVG